MNVKSVRAVAQPRRAVQPRPVVANAAPVAPAAPVRATLEKPTAPSLATRFARAGLGMLLGGGIGATVALGGMIALSVIGAPVGFMAGALGFTGIGLAGVAIGGLWQALRPNSPSEGAKKDFASSPRADQIKSLLSAGKTDEALKLAQSTSEAIYVASKLRDAKKDYNPALQRALDLSTSAEDTLAVASGLKDGLKDFQTTMKVSVGAPYQAPDFNLFPKAYAKLQDQLKAKPDAEASYQFTRQMAQIPVEWYPQLDKSVQDLAEKLELYYPN